MVQPILWLSRRWNRVHGSREAQLRLLQVKERALRQQELIAAAAARMAAQEEAQGGLIIVRVCLRPEYVPLLITANSLWVLHPFKLHISNLQNLPSCTKYSLHHSKLIERSDMSWYLSL